MNRRNFLTLTGAAAAVGVSLWPSVSRAAAAGQSFAARYENVLILVELKGGNDGLNTVVP